MDGARFTAVLLSPVRSSQNVLRQLDFPLAHRRKRVRFALIWPPPLTRCQAKKSQLFAQGAQFFYKF